MLELTGKTAPKTGLEGKFSVYHAAAAALLRGDGSPAAFTDEAVFDPDIVALRGRVTATSDKSIAEESVRIAVNLKDDRRIERFVRHAIGSLERPLSRTELEAKFRGSSEPVLGSLETEAVLQLAWNLPDLSSIEGLMAKTAPADA